MNTVSQNDATCWSVFVTTPCLGHNIKAKWKIPISGKPLETERVFDKICLIPDAGLMPRHVRVLIRVLKV